MTQIYAHSRPYTDELPFPEHSDAWCPGCRAEQPFETPPCAEHGTDCPELACVVCGWATIGSFEIASMSAPRPAPVAV